MKLWGCFLVIIGSISFVGFVFAALVSKLFSLSDNPIIQAIQNDRLVSLVVISDFHYKTPISRYYCFLAPLTLPALLVSVYFHWLTMKLFKHA
ncbi:hypothetical protein BRARA_J02149 [Brassica rapa]|uniref:Uncharacterized protein n=1 Tax=Brassica campestris TaxID=3711 RepID=A0A397XRZ1_BRACM|nr:hypothetical protein BRARA_J02149 [Brassica rapa]